jgi:hypothetical protein
MLKLARYLRRFVDKFDEPLDSRFLKVLCENAFYLNTGDRFEESIKETHLDHGRSA